MTIGRQIRFLCGQLGLNLVVRYFFTWHLKFADQRDPRTRAVLLPASIVGLGFFAARIFDAITDPLAGALCDRWVDSGRPRSRLLWYAFAVPSLATLLIFAPGHGWPQALRWAALLGGMFVFFAGYTLYAIPYWSLVRDYASSPAEEQRNSEKLGVGVLLATGGVGIVSPLAVEALGYLQAGAAFAVVGAGLMILPIYAGPAEIAERGSGPASAAPRERTPQPWFWRRMGQALAHRRFVAVLWLFCGAQMAFTVITAGAPFIVSALLGGSDRDVAKVMAPLLATAIPFAIFLVGPVARGGWQPAVTVASLLLGVVYAGSAALGHAVVGSAMTTAMVLFALAGPMAAVILGLEAKAVVDCASENQGEWTSLYFGVFNLVVKALNGLASLLVGLLAGLAHRPGWELHAVRAMGLVAALLLWLGVAGYLAVERRRRV